MTRQEARTRLDMKYVRLESIAQAILQAGQLPSILLKNLRMALADVDEAKAMYVEAIRKERGDK